MTTKTGKSYLRKLYLRSRLLPVLAFLVVFVSVFLFVRETQFYQSLTSSAATGQAQVFLQPDNNTLPPTGVFNLWVTTEEPLAFANITLQFDPSLLTLISSPDLTTSPLTKIIRTSSVAQATQTGQFDLTLGLEPNKLSVAPQGTLKLATFRFSPTSTQFSTASLKLDSASTQLVSTSALPFALTFQNANLTLNPTPTPTPIPTVHPTPSPVPSPFPSLTPAPTPTSQVTDDRVTIHSVAVYRSWWWRKSYRISIIASSDMAPEADLQALDLGSLRYSTRRQKYYGTFTLRGELPTQVTVNSNYGGSATFPVRSR